MRDRAGQRGLRRVAPVRCEYGTVDAVPAAADVVSAVCLWEGVEDPPELFASIARKLAPGGKLCLVEADSAALADAGQWARRSGFRAFSAPPVLGDEFCVEVLELDQA